LVEQQVSFDSLARYFTEGLILIWNEDYNILIPEFGLARPAFLKLIGNIV